MCSLFCTLPDCPSTLERSILYNKAFWQTWLEQTVRSDKHRWLWVCVSVCACVSLSTGLFVAVVFLDVFLWLLCVYYYYLFVSGGEKCSTTNHVCSLDLFACITERDREIISSRVEKERGRNWQEDNMVIIRQTGTQNRHSASMNMKAEGSSERSDTEIFTLSIRGYQSFWGALLFSSWTCKSTESLLRMNWNWTHLWQYDSHSPASAGIDLLFGVKFHLSRSVEHYLSALHSNCISSLSFKLYCAEWLSD